MGLLTLAERVEGAEGADRELDGAIWCLLHGEDAVLTPDLPYYTGSIDAAMSLVPEGWIVGLEQWPSPLRSERGESGEIRQWGKYNWRATLTEDGGQFGQVTPVAATPALALCAAALRALSQGDPLP